MRDAGGGPVLCGRLHDRGCVGLSLRRSCLASRLLDGTENLVLHLRKSCATAPENVSTSSRTLLVVLRKTLAGLRFAPKNLGTSVRRFVSLVVPANGIFDHF
jgi:hypothetical protein